MIEANRETTRGSAAAAATAGGIIAQQVAGKAVRDAFFLSNFHVRSLPSVMAAAAILSLLAVLWISRLIARYSPRRVLPVLFAAGGAALVLEWALIFVSRPVAAVAVYLHVVVFSPVVLSTFWSLINERYDPHTAKRAVSRIASGGALGGVLGGLGAWRVASLVSVSTTVLLLAGVNVACLVGTLVVSRTEGGAVPPSQRLSQEEPVSALGVLRGAPYMRNLAMLVALGAATSCLLDYVFSAQVTAVYGKGPELLRFFALFGVVVSALSLLLQLTLGQIAMEKLGLAVNIAVLPGIIILGGAAGLAVPGVLSLTLLRGAEMVQRNTLFRSAYELLYTPLEEKRKRATKALIDVGFDRFGTVCGSGVAMVVLGVSRHDQGILLGVVVLLALATLPLARHLNAGYVAALEQGLREGERKLDIAPDEPRGPSRVADEPARDALIREVERVRDHQDDGAKAAAVRVQASALLAKAEALLSSDVERARLALRDWGKDQALLASFAILHLGHEGLHRDARTALRAVATEVTGQLLDALVSPSLDFAIRRRIPAVLAVCPTQRAADGLLLGLDDERFEVRYACGRALATLAERGADVSLPRDRVITMLLREIARASEEILDLDDDGDDEPSTVVEVIARDRVSRTVENLFSLLSLILDREPLRLCFRALQHENDRHRGTALEYLQTVLPPELRDVLLPVLSEVGPLPSPRPASEVLAELTAAFSASSSQAKARPEASTKPPS